MYIWNCPCAKTQQYQTPLLQKQNHTASEYRIRPIQEALPCYKTHGKKSSATKTSSETRPESQINANQMVWIRLTWYLGRARPVHRSRRLNKLRVSEDERWNITSARLSFCTDERFECHIASLYMYEEVFTGCLSSMVGKWWPGLPTYS